MSPSVAPRFQATPTPAGTELRLLVDGKQAPRRDWALLARRGAELCERLLIDGAADEGEDFILVEHAAVARLATSEAARLDLPAATSLRAVVEGDGIMVRPGFTVSIRWTRPGGQNVIGVERVGAWLREPDGPRRLPETLFAVAEAVDAHRSAAGDEAARLHALARLREALPPAATAGTADGGGLLGSVTIVEADAFSLETTGEGDMLQLSPVLHRAGDGARLLPDDRQRAFGEGQFLRFPTARPVYSLPGGVYLILSPPLRQALEAVRRACDGSPAQRRAMLREPRAAVRAAIGDEADETVLEGLLVETPAWSDRVIGLGLWQHRVLPWIDLPGSEWFGPQEPADRGMRSAGLQVGDRRLKLQPDEAERLARRVRAAIEQGAPTVTEATLDGTMEIPAVQATLDALEALAALPGRPSPAPGPPPETLIIEPNEDALTIEALVRPRVGPISGAPACLRSTLKAHQREGLEWLQGSWLAGAPGVLLADDMGLGKTLQGLAFLAWLREAMRSGVVAREPLLVVAPTGLLQNWRAEHDRHLHAPGLGTALLAYGKGLAALRRKPGDGGQTLDRAAIAAADWVLTTYETLRDHLSDFGAVRFAAMLLDEAQKAKTPGIRLTDAVKGINAAFRVALTGTPVENRLSDLWCIVDCACPGHLRDLRWFSARYEADPDVEKLKELKSFLDRPVGRRPPTMLRRLKEDRLPDLPPREDVLLRGEMTGLQRAAYEEALELGRHGGGGGVLTALHRLRSASLHGGHAGADVDDAAVIAASVRLRLTLEVLDRVAADGERALVFLDDIDFMARLAGLLQRRYRLEDTPMTISGSVSGLARQSRVDRFQTAPAGFGVMLLSPKAGGVGLTLTRANHAIHLSRWWNPATEDQCSGRIHRIGQERPVTVHVPLAVLPDGRPSFDENLQALLQRKRSLTRDALMPPEADGQELAVMLRATLG